MRRRSGRLVRWLPGAAAALPAILGLALAPAAAPADSQPFRQDPMGPISDVTGSWQRYQPAAAFCIKPDATQYTPGGTGATTSGRERLCRRSGFRRRTTGLVKVQVMTPELCPTCRRLFIDFSQIKPGGSQLEGRAFGHVYYHLASFNPTYTVGPTAHSPNTKNFHNDKLLTPDGSPQQPLVASYEEHAMSYVSDTTHFIHNASQGPYYIGPWYVNRGRQRIRGVYLDVNLDRALRLPVPSLNAIGYVSGFDSGGAYCPPGDPDLLYAGCVDWWGGSSAMIDPFA